MLYQIRILLKGGKKLNKDKLSKAVVMGAIVLFISLSGLNSVTSKDISISDDKILKDNNVIEQMDDNKEIITRISGCVGLNYCKWDGILLKKVELWTMGFPSCYIEINGYKKPLFPLRDSKFNEKPTHIIAERFLGFIGLSNDWYYSVSGVAIGNIYWK